MRAKAKLVLPAVVVLFALQAWMQGALIYPFWKKNYAPRTDSDLSSLTPDQMLFAMAGFREMIAGLLWVRADSYFDEGNYDAILPMIRIVTMLDPKQIDVYATGMWHIAYNFTDEANRSDRRYVSPAIALGKEGAKLNDYTYELHFETGWIWYHKVDDEYEQAVKYFKKASEYKYDEMYDRYIKDGHDPVVANWLANANAIPPARANILAQAYLRNGQAQEALDYYWSLYQTAEKKMGVDALSQERINRDTIENNLDNHLLRMSQRGVFAKERGASLEGYDVYPPFDVKFSARVTVIDPKVIVAEGTWGVLPVGTRIRFIVRDADFDLARPGGMVWDSENVDLHVDTKVTYLQDALFVRNQRFSRRIDMGRDVTMYPFFSDKYVIEFYYNPRSAPAHIQDKFGFNGEGMTADPMFLNTEIRPGQRVVFARLEVPKDMMLLTGEYRRGLGKAAYVQTPNYDERATVSTDQVIKVPGLRSE